MAGFPDKCKLRADKILIDDENLGFSGALNELSLGEYTSLCNNVGEAASFRREGCVVMTPKSVEEMHDR